MMDLQEREMLVVKEGEQYLLVKKADIQELMDQLNEQPVWVSGLKWLSEQTGGMSPETLREKILYPYREDLEEFIAYPEKSGQPWRFNIKRMKEWLAEDKNFSKVNK